MRDGVGEARAEAEGELAIARLALDGGETAHAAQHLGSALAADPSLPDVYDALRQVGTLTGDALSLFPVPRDGAHIGAAAARSYLLARSGAFDEALRLLCLVVRADPAKPWAAAGWLGSPGLADLLDPGQAATSLARIAQRLGDPAGADQAALVRPFLDVARGVAARLRDPKLLALLSGLPRRLGETDEAIAWCQRAEALLTSPDSAPGIMLGNALRNAGRFDEAQQAWRRALGNDPGNVFLHVDIAEDLAGRGHLAEAIAWTDRALALEPDHEKAFPSACQMRYAQDGDISHLVRLADWWRAHPEHGYAGTMLAKACQDRDWLNRVPAPTEAVSNLLAQVAQAHPEPGALAALEVTLTLSALECPSALAAASAAMPRLRVDVQDVPEPDIRVPVADVRYHVWAYQGTRAVPDVAPPSPAAAAALRAVAAGGQWAHPVEAYDRAVGLAGLSLGDLLGLLAHVPPVPDAPGFADIHRRFPAYWPRFAQAWACLGLLHYQPDEPWPSSARRAVLIDLARGVEDWVTDAALFALVTAAWTDPGTREEIAQAVVSHRFLDGVTAYQKRSVTIAEPMAHLVLATPGMVPEVASLARELIAREQGQRQQDRP